MHRADGLGEDIVIGLMRFSHLRVVSRSSARRFSGEAADIAILTKEAVQQLAAKGYVRSPTDLVLSVIGIAVGDSAPTPVMKTTEDFVAFMKATLLRHVCQRSVS